MVRTSKLSLALAATGLLAAAATPAHAILNEFSVSDGYSGAFSTPVWSYHPNWSLVAGNAGSNYVAQHGYGSGFAVTEPFGLVFRNDNQGSNNWTLRYQVDPGDVGGANPASLATDKITMGWDINGNYGNIGGPGSPMLVMGFGGSMNNPGFKVAISNNTRFMYSDPGNNLVESTVGFLTQWNRVQLVMDFVNQTYSLSMSSMTGNPLNASNTWTILQTYPIVSGAPFANSMSSMTDIWWDIRTDPNGGGFSKNFFDHFTGVSRNAPAPGALGLLGVGALVMGRRRR